jgi:transposase InsO family protein
MKLHANATTCPNSRALIAQRVLEQCWSLRSAAEAAGVSEPTARKWVRRYRSGDRKLLDRSCAPRRTPKRTPRRTVEAIEALRRLWMTASEISEVLGIALSTVSLWLKRIGLGKRSRLAPPEPPNRYERRRTGELLHIDVKKLGRIQVPGHRITGNRRQHARRTMVGNQGRYLGTAGWECVHVCVDDYSRLAYAEVLADERGETAAGFLRRAVAWFSEQGVLVERVMTDNGSPYISNVHAAACTELGLRHLRTRPYRPRTNGKAERFIRTLLNEWAWNRLYGSSAERADQLGPWLERYNFRRPHGALGHKPPGSRLNNLVGSYT